MDITGNPIQELPPRICCIVHGLRTDVDCGASSCSHYGNPLTAAGCKADEQQLDIPLSNQFNASLCSRQCSATQRCPTDLPPWNPSGSADCARTQSGSLRCVILCSQNAHCRHPHGFCAFGLLDSSVRDKSGQPIGICVYRRY